MTLKTRLSILLLSTPVLVFVVVGGLIGRASATSGDGTIRELRVFDGTRLLRGQPGSKVTLTVIRGNAADPHEIALVREKAPATVVSGKATTPEVGYVRIASFREGVVEQLKKQVADLSRAGAKSLIIDVRHTAEGPLDNGVAAARLFVKSGTLAMTGGREANKDAEKNGDKDSDDRD